MAKTVLHKELKEKKKAKNEQFKERHGINFSKRTKLIICGVCAVLVATPVLIHFGSKKEKPVETELSSESIVVDDKYVVDSNGEITYLTGDEVVKSIGDIYSAKIKTTYEGGSSDFTVEVDARNDMYIEYYHGTKNNVVFDEVGISTLTYSSMLANSNDQYTPVEETTYAYVDCKALMEQVLCGEELTEKDNVYTSKITLANISNVFPYEISSNYYTKIMEEDENVIISEILASPVTVTMTYGTDSVTLAATCEFGTVNIEIKNIDTLSKDFSQYIQ